MASGAKDASRRRVVPLQLAEGAEDKDPTVGDNEVPVITDAHSRHLLELPHLLPLLPDLETNNFQFARKYLCLSDAVVERNKEMNENDKQRIFIFSKLEYYLSLMKTSAEKIQERKNGQMPCPVVLLQVPKCFVPVQISLLKVMGLNTGYILKSFLL